MTTVNRPPAVRTPSSSRPETSAPDGTRDHRAAGGGPRAALGVVLEGIRRVVAAGSSLFWTALVIIPVYWVVVTSLRDQAGFFSTSPLQPPTDPTLANYRLVWESGFVTSLVNSVVVTVATVAIATAAALLASFVIVRSGSRWSRWYFRMFLLGLAIPLQAVIIPVYLLIIRLDLYDSLVAVILPSAAFAIPVSVLILVGFLRDVPTSLYDAMEVDGAGPWRILWSLVVPLARPALTTVAVYNGLNAWNGFLFPLILTQDPTKATLPLALNVFRGEFGINVPATMAAVVLATLPMLAVFLLARRQLVAGLTAGFTK